MPRPEKLQRRMSQHYQQLMIARHLRNVREKIMKHGWMVQGVFGDEGGPGFAYTIGLTEAGLPELLISGNLDNQVAMQLLNAAAALHVANEFQPGDEISDIANVVFRVVACKPDAPVQQALNYYHDPKGSKGTVRTLQLVWPDDNGLYPGPFSRSDGQPLY